MLFNSIKFAIFFPIVFALYWIWPRRFRWMLLLMSSYYFYMSWNVKYALLIFITTVVSYAAGIFLERTTIQKEKRIILIVSLIICLGILFVFKYLGFVFESISNLFSFFSIQVHPVTLNLILPVGISFYTFQTLGYVIDVYKGKITAEKNFGYYATFVSFFPQLVAGPIERTENLLPQIKTEHTFKESEGLLGTQYIILGLYKKVIADTLAFHADIVFEDIYNYEGFALLLATFFFSVQIYCDFSGYSDIARGTAKLFGIELMENFRSPYFSRSVKEFWKRWHISLSTWFKDYVYIPLGGNRCSKIRQRFNMIATFLVSGLWHGANWTFVMWGGGTWHCFNIGKGFASTV